MGRRAVPQGPRSDALLFLPHCTPLRPSIAVPWLVSYPGYNGLETATERTTHATYVTNLLRALPDVALYDAEVAVEKVSSCPNLAFAGCVGYTSGIKYTVGFNHSTVYGNMRPLKVNFYGCDTQGCQPRHAGLYSKGTITSTVDAGHEASDRESVECSNHGTCDYSTGLCDCHEQFTGEACDTVDVLA